MTAQAHSGRAHSKLGPSAASRWMVCAGSVSASEGMPNKSTVFALEGTAAHEFNEMILSTGADPRDWLGGAVRVGSEWDGVCACGKKEADGVKCRLGATHKSSKAVKRPAEIKKFLTADEATDTDIDRNTWFPIDEEMVEGCELTIDVIEEYYSRVDGDELMLETRLDMSWIHPKLFGTGDILIYKRKTKHLIVLDYKYGSGHVVEVKDNPQVRTYAVGAAKLFEKEGVEIISSVIIQPRAFHKDGAVRKETIDLFDLVEFESTLAVKARATDDANAPLCAGNHCKFCPASPTCDTLRDYNHSLIGVKPHKGELAEKHLPAPDKMASEHLGRIVREVQIIEGWCRRVMQYAHGEAMEGRVPGGTKLVAKRAYRKFTIGEGDVITLLDLEGIGEDDYMTEPKLLSLAKIEKVVGKKTFNTLFDGAFKKESSGYVLAPVEDDREAVKLDNSDAFDAIEDDDE